MASPNEPVPPSYQLVINKGVAKDIRKLGAVDQIRLHRAISQLEQNPRPQGKKIKPFFGIEHGYRLRVGMIRVLYVVDDANKQVKIIDVGYRGSIY